MSDMDNNWFRYTSGLTPAECEAFQLFYNSQRVKWGELPISKEKLLLDPRKQIFGSDFKVHGDAYEAQGNAGGNGTKVSLVIFDEIKGITIKDGKFLASGNNNNSAKEVIK